MKKYFWDIIRHKYAVFSGRASRKEFWFFHLWYALTIFVLAMVFFGLYFAAMDGDRFFGLLSTLVGIVIGLINLGVFIPVIALTVRRLHDAGLTGWLIMVSVIFAPMNIIFGLLPPTPGKNQYDI
ncbi:DUF805 domain-containing protein [Candidatus Proelusimicrobium volucris]|uniref:DUF805 domain-containing protein n=1 Tax=Candidatus Proelusimicrobium volucris TaxID=3416225 RepID=UPI003D10858F